MLFWKTKKSHYGRISNRCFFWIDTKCMQDISFSLSIGNFMSFDWLLVLKIFLFTFMCFIRLFYKYID